MLSVLTGSAEQVAKRIFFSHFRERVRQTHILNHPLSLTLSP
jgi:hypothetical protein